MAGLFKKKKKEKKEEPETRSDVAVPETGVSETLIEENDLQNILGDVVKNSGIDEVTEKIDDLARKLDEMQSRLERHDSLIGSLENELSEIRNVNEEMQDNIKRLLDIYEVVSQKINPFINMGEKQEISADTVIPAPSAEQNIPVVKSMPDTPEPLKPESARQPESIESVPVRAHEERREYEEKPQPGKPLLTYIKKDYYTVVLLMRWIEFLFEHVKRDKITLLLDYYVDIGWISKEVKSEIMAYARGEVQDVTKYFPDEEIEAEIETPEGTIKAPEPKVYKKVDDWRLSAEDHLKSLLFIMKIAGIEVNKDRLNSLEQEIEKFKKSLWEYHGV